MRRRLIAVGVALALLLAAAAAGWILSTRVAPERLRRAAEEELRRRIGPVEVAAVHLRFAWGLALEMEDVRAPAAIEGAGFGAERLTFTFGTRSVLRGEPELRRVAAVGPWLEALQDGEGRWHPELVARLLGEAPDAEGPRPDAPRTRETPASLAEALSALGEATLPRISIRDGRLRVTRAGWEGRREPEEVAAEAIEVDVGRSRIGGELHWSARARLGSRDAAADTLELEATVARGMPPRAGLSVVDLDLETAALLAHWIAGPSFTSRWPSLAGRVGGHVGWVGPGEEPAHRLAFDLALPHLEARRFPGAPLEVKLDGVGARGTLEIAPRRLRVVDARIAAGEAVLEGRGRLDLPARDRSELALALRGRQIPLAAAGALLASSQDLGLGFRLAGGTIERASATLEDASLGAWRGFVSDPLRRWPARLELEAAVRGAVIEPRGSEPLREVHADVRWSGKRVEIEIPRALHGERPLPALDLAIAGWPNLLPAIEARWDPPAVPPLPGLGVLDEWIARQKKPGDPPRWVRLDLRAERIRHPLVWRPLEDVTATLRPAHGGVRVTIERARWGGVRIEGLGSRTGDPPGRIDLELAALPSSGLRAGEDPPPAPPDRDAVEWLEGRFDAQLDRLGPLLARRATGIVRAGGHRAELRAVEVELEPQGAFQGDVALDLSQRDRVPVEGGVELIDGSLPDLMRDLRMDAEAATGTLVLGASLAGRLVPGEPLLAGLHGPVSGHARDGEIRRRLPVAFAIAAASDTFNPFRSRDALPYEAIDGELHLADGYLQADSLALKGPAHRLVAAGRVDVVGPEHRVEAVVGLFFFRTLDAVIGKLPLLNTFLLGEDENLVSAYFAVEGPWSQPAARLLPSKLLAEGPTSFMVEGVPGFVRSGLSRLWGLFALRRLDPAEGEEGEATP